MNQKPRALPRKAQAKCHRTSVLYIRSHACYLKGDLYVARRRVSRNSPLCCIRHVLYAIDHSCSYARSTAFRPCIPALIRPRKYHTRYRRQLAVWWGGAALSGEYRQWEWFLGNYRTNWLVEERAVGQLLARRFSRGCVASLELHVVAKDSFTAFRPVTILRRAVARLAQLQTS